MKYTWEVLFENLKADLTYDQTLKPAMIITDPEEAKAYKAALVKWGVDKHNQSEEESLNVTNQNLGYFAGYYDSETQARVEELFLAVHPIFGSIHGKRPTPEEAFKMGQEWAEGAGAKELD